jgi:Tfp pilus assembly protein PilF
MKKRAEKKQSEKNQSPSKTTDSSSPSVAVLTPLWLAFALILVTVLTYVPVRNYDFVSYEDVQYVTQNDQIAGGLTRQSIQWALTTDRAGYWVPLTWLSHIVDVELYGHRVPGPPHVTNALLHIINTLLLFGVLRRMTAGLYESAIVAGLFAVHPLHVESVAWIAQRKDVLSALLWMLTLWAYDGYVRRRGSIRYVLVVLVFALGLMAKPILVTLPFVLLLLDVWPLRRVRLESGQGSIWLRLALEKLPLLVLAIASSIVTVVFSAQRGSVGGLDAFPIQMRMANAVVSYATYIRDMFWPANLAAFYPYESFSALRVAGSAAVLSAVSFFVIRNARAHPYLLVGWLWYLGTLLPVVGLVQSGTQSRADRFTYLPLIGLFIMMAWGIPHLLARWRYRTMALAVAGVVLIGASAFAARRQVHYWENHFTLWERALEVTDGNFVAHNILGLALSDSGRLDEAIGHYREALSIRSEYAEGHNNLGIALARQGRSDEAVSEFRKAVGIPNAHAEMYYNLGHVLADQGKIDEAIAQYNEALRIDPSYVPAHTKLADAFFLQGRMSEALSRYREALRINPSFAVAHNNLGVALSAQEQYEEAIVHYTAALRLKPDFADAHNGLGTVLANQRQYAQAIPHFMEALRIQPGHLNARANLEQARELQRTQGHSPR